MRQSIAIGPVEGKSPETMSIRVGSNLEYALFIEQGTGLYGPYKTPIVPTEKKALVFKTGGVIVFARSVKGRKATPYLGPALASTG